MVTTLMDMKLFKKCFGYLVLLAPLVCISAYWTIQYIILNITAQ